jgi:chromosome transmission fidelity protein 1
VGELLLILIVSYANSDLIDTILSIHTISLSSTTISTCITQLKIYHTRFKTRLTAAHAIHLKRLAAVLVALSNVCSDHLETAKKDKKPNGKTEEHIMTTTEFASKLGMKVEGINLLEIEKYLRSSRVARKISGYCDKEEEKEKQKGMPVIITYARLFNLALATGKAFERRKGVTPPLHSVESFIVALCDASEGELCY